MHWLICILINPKLMYRWHWINKTLSIKIASNICHELFRIFLNTDWLPLSVSISRGQCVSSLFSSFFKQTCYWSNEITLAAQIKTSPLFSWQSSAYLLCLPLYPTPVLTALLNVKPSSSGSVFQLGRGRCSSPTSTQRLWWLWPH